MTHITFKTLATFAIAGILLTGCSANSVSGDTGWKAKPDTAAPPSTSAAPAAPPPVAPPPVPAPPVAPPPAPPAPAPPAPPAEPAVQPAKDPQFKTCTEVKKNKLGPYRKGQAEYEWYQDKDKDGVVCE